jgi:phosphoserine phosphatase
VGVIYLIRHGETDWNHEQRLQGITDVPLNQAGIVQGRHLAIRMRRVRATYIFTSPLRRARHTAAILHWACRCPMIVRDELREIDHGVWTGMTVSEIRQRFPLGLAYWRTSPEKLRVEKAEPLQQAYCRASRFLCQAMEMASRTDLIVVSHGVTIALLICAALGSPLEHLWAFPQVNTCVHALYIQRHQVTACQTLNHDSLMKRTPPEGNQKVMGIAGLTGLIIRAKVP